MINISTNKIDAIRAVRQFTEDTFGVKSGLMAAKGFVDSIIADQEARALGKSAALPAVQHGWFEPRTREQRRVIIGMLADLRLEESEARVQRILAALREP